MNNLGKMIKQQRMAFLLTITELAKASGVSSSHLGRIERGERLPSAHVLRRIAKPLGFGESELFTIAGFLSPALSDDAKEEAGYTISRLDGYVARVLAKEPFRVQRCVIEILSILKSLPQNMERE